MEVRQEIEGPQGEQLEFARCGQVLQHEDNSRREEKLSAAQIRDKETILQVKENFQTTHAQKGKRERAPLHSR